MMIEGQVPWQHTGAVLLGGAGSRMGAPKATVRLPSGASLAETVVAALEEVCERVVTVGGEPFPSHDHLVDLRPGLGPLAGIETLVASGLDDQYLICPCDIPYVVPDVLRRLTVPTSAQATIFSAAGDDRVRSLPLRVASSVLPLVTSQLDAGRRAVHVLLARLDVNHVRLNADEAKLLRDADTPEDVIDLSRLESDRGA